MASQGRGACAGCRRVGAGLVQAGVVEPRDVGVFQPRQDVALALEAQRRGAIGKGVQRQLQRHLALVGAVGAFGAPDRGHAAAAQWRHQPPGADALARRQPAGRAGGVVGARHAEQGPAVEPFGRRLVGMGGEQRAQRVRQAGVRRLQRGQPAARVGSGWASAWSNSAESRAQSSGDNFDLILLFTHRPGATGHARVPPWCAVALNA